MKFTEEYKYDVVWYWKFRSFLQFQYGGPPPSPKAYVNQPFPMERPFLFFSATI